MGLPEGSAAERLQFHTGVTSQKKKPKTHLQLHSQCRIALPHFLEDLSSVRLIDTVVLPWVTALSKRGCSNKTEWAVAYEVYAHVWHMFFQQVTNTVDIEAAVPLALFEGRKERLQSDSCHR